MPSFRPAWMIAPTAQKRRAATDCTGTGMLSRLRETIVRRKRDWTIQFGGSALPSHTISHLLPVIPASSPVSFRSNVFETLEPSSAVEDEEQCRTNRDQRASS